MRHIGATLILVALPLAACGGGDEADCGQPGAICTWAGTGTRSFDGDGRPVKQSSLYWPVDMEFAPDGPGYVLDWQNHKVRRVEPDGTFKTVIGGDLPGDGPPDLGDLTDAGASGRTVELNHPTDIQFLADGTLILAAWHNHKIRRFDPRTGLVHVLCGREPGDVADNVPLKAARLNQPKSVAVTAAGDIYVADGNNARIRKLGRDGMVTTVAGSRMAGFSGDGGPPMQALFNMQQRNENPEPGGSIALDGNRLYIADTLNHRIRRIDFDAALVETVAGTGEGGFSGDGGPALAARLNAPRDVELGPDGRLYIADTDNHRVRVVDLATGIITAVAGDGEGPGFAGDGGPAVKARLNRPFGIAFDREGALYISDTLNSRIRRVQP
jgi:hypothetical protein